MNIYFGGRVSEIPDNLPDHIKCISLDAWYTLYQDLRIATKEPGNGVKYIVSVVDDEFFTFFKIKYGYSPAELFVVDEKYEQENHDANNYIISADLDKITNILKIEENDKVLLLRRIDF